MPELPEVESVRRGLVRHMVGRRVTGVDLRRRDILIAPGDPSGGFSRQRGTRASAQKRTMPAAFSPEDLLADHTIVEIRRLGKQLAIVAELGGVRRALGVQLGMTGHIGVVERAADTTGAHVHAVWAMGEVRVVFEDPRRFGGLRVFRSLADVDAHWRDLGPDALTIGAEQLGAALQNSRRAIKAALLDQRVLAGVGNIYADEALFRAAIHPATRADRVSADKVDDLARRIREVLHEAVDAGGSTIRDYLDAEGGKGGYQLRHRVYGRSGLPCLSCGRTLSSGTLGQRTTVWCAACQPKRVVKKRT